MIRLIAATLCGVVIGTLSGILGVGGGSMMVPLFRLGFGMAALTATGTSLFTMIFTSIAGSISHIRNGMCLVRLAVLSGVCGALTAPLGVHLSTLSPAWMVMTGTALVVGYSATTMIRKGLEVPRGSVATKKKKGLPEEKLEPPQLSRRQYILGAIAGIIAGIAGGYVGLGGGFLLIPFYISIVDIPMKFASPASLLAVAILAASGAVAQGALGNIDIPMGLAMAAGSIPAAMLSANLIKRIPERSLRLGFGAFLLLVAISLAVNEILL